MSKRCYYEVLGVVRESSEREIATAYRKLAIRFHPDSNPGDEDATRKFKEASEAYEVLRDAETRARYDRFGHAGVGEQAGFRDVEDIFDAFGDLFGGGGGMFGEIFGRRRGPRRGRDLRCEVELTLEEAAQGVRKEISFRRSEACDECHGSGAAKGSKPTPCPQCHGRGRVVQSAGILRVQTACPHCEGQGQIIKDPCISCRGAGYVARPVTRVVQIPKGVDNGVQVRVPGEGEPSPDGGPPGDCYCFITVRQHSLFQREGSHLILKLPISFSQAALGATIEVPTLDGREDLTVPAGTQSGEVFRVYGKGVADPRSGRMGDLLVQTIIETPKKLTERQRDLLRELAELEHKHVTPERKGFLERLREYFAPEAHESSNGESS